MDKKLLFTLLFVVVLFSLFFYFQKGDRFTPVDNKTIPATILPLAGNTNAPLITTSTSTGDLFLPPLPHAGERVTKKKFGQYITPENSPVQPERFRGYHTGADFEIFPEELDAAVKVHAVCSGKLDVKRTASGYGGVAVQGCDLKGEPITVVYGHLDLKTITKNAGDNLTAGDIIGDLGADKSAATDGERKHLHLSFRKGESVDLRGYVQTEEELSSWLEPCLYACHD